MDNDLKQLFNDYIVKDGKKLRRIYVSYVNHPSEPCLCDCCDETKQCVSLNMLCEDYAIICKDCLSKIVRLFDEKDEEEEEDEEK